MSRSTLRLTWVAAGVGVVAAVTILSHVLLSSTENVRDIHLVVRDMTYYVDGRGAPNPTLRVARGERVRIRVSNEDPGMTHDFAVTAWGRATRLIEHKGEGEVELTAPDRPGDTAYACRPHGELMRGTIRVE